MTPMQLTIAKLKSDRILHGVVERWVPAPVAGGMRIDFLGIIDVIAVLPAGILAIQVGTSSDRLKHIRKIFLPKNRPKARAWVAAGGELEVWSWSKLRGVWRVRIDSVTLEVLDNKKISG